MKFWFFYLPVCVKSKCDHKCLNSEVDLWCKGSKSKCLLHNSAYNSSLRFYTSWLRSVVELGQIYQLTFTCNLDIEKKNEKVNENKQSSSWNLYWTDIEVVVVVVIGYLLAWHLISVFIFCYTFCPFSSADWGDCKMAMQSCHILMSFQRTALLRLLEISLDTHAY